MTPIQYPIEPAAQAQSRAAEIDAHFDVAIFSVAAALTAAGVTVLVMDAAGALRAETAPSWLLAMLTLGLLHILTALTYKRAPAWRAHWRTWAYVTSAITLAEGLGWGVAPFAVPVAGDQAAMFLVMITTLCVSVGSAIGSGRYLPTRVIAFVAPTVPYLVYSALTRERIIHDSFFLILLFLAAIGHLSLTADRAFRNEAKLRRHNSRLAFDLAREKEAAERANVAKSKFLAAASHDLRQPIHALGLYVGALRNLAATPPLRTLAGKMETSIAAMDRLFAAVLDISQLDAGVVEARVAAIAIDELVAVVCDDFREEAERKGLTLTAERSGLILASDPLLVERILRNLVSNAVRYTDRGGVRVRCRRRSGAAALQVWDSGRGIARRQMPEIFEEYVQLDNAERDREKGLGLGLAIVRRLSDLLGAPIEASSRVGRGSCFAVRLPLGSADPLQKPPTVADAPVEPQRGLVVVVDDDPVVRDAMRTALTGWGLQVVDASSGGEALARLERAGTPPALLLCDYRLPHGEDGLEVVARFRARWGEALPAILVTGDTAADRLTEAHARGVQLLHKPVVHGKLRAAVGELVTRRVAGGARTPVLVGASARNL